jgi:hemerythrin
MWREQLSVGNDVIDTDHKHLIDVINQAEHSMSTRNRTELIAALDDLAGYSTLHFEREEKIASAAGYKNVANLNASHKALLTKLEQMREEFDSLDQEWSQDAVEHFTNLLRSWLIDHVIKEDLLMKPDLKKTSPLLNPY